MGDTYVPNPTLSTDANAILKEMRCIETRRQIGHCIVIKDGRCNVAGLLYVSPGGGEDIRK